MNSLTVQQGSEIQTSLEFDWVKRGWLANGPDFEWDLKSGQKCPDFDWSSYQMVGTIAIAIAKAQPFENSLLVSKNN